MGFNLKKILKSLLFSTGEPLTIKDVQAVISRYHQEQDAAKSRRQPSRAEGVDMLAQPEEDAESSAEPVEQAVIEDIFAQVPTLLTATQIREAMEEIASEFEQSGDVCRLVQSASGFKLVISKDYADWVRLLRNDPRPQRLTRAALETLAIVAYRQPVTRAEIEAIRGVNADGALSRLSEKDLIFISGRADLPGRPIQYATTQTFLDYVGINSIEELPASDVLTPNQISEWIKRASNPTAVKDSDVGLPEENPEDAPQVEDGKELFPDEPETAEIAPLASEPEDGEDASEDESFDEPANEAPSGEYEKAD